MRHEDEKVWQIGNNGGKYGMVGRAGRARHYGNRGDHVVLRNAGHVVYGADGGDVMTKRNKVYVGVRHDAPYAVFRSKEIPTYETHGAWYGAVIGPFRTRRAAEFMARYGRGNPHLRCVSDAERLTR